MLLEINPKVLSFVALKELEKGGHLVERCTYWKGNGIQNLCVIVNVGRNKLNETYLATSRLTGNHWACFLVAFSSTDIFYCDSLAWPAPPNLLLKLKLLTSLIKVNYWDMPDFEVHVVNKDTEKNVFPYQGPNQNICGNACLISAILITDSYIRHELLRERLAWLRMLYNYSDFARYLFIKWYKENKITLADLGHAEEVSVVIEFCSFH